MGTVASTNSWWRVEGPTSDAGDSGLAQKATMMNPSSELLACWRGQWKVLSGQGYRMRGSSLSPSAKRGSGQLSLKKNLTRPNGLRGETQQSTVMDDELDVAQWAPCRGKNLVPSGLANQWLPQLRYCAKGDNDWSVFRTISPLVRATTGDIRSRWTDERIFPVSLSHSHPELAVRGYMLLTIPCNNQKTAIRREGEMIDGEAWDKTRQRPPSLTTVINHF